MNDPILTMHFIRMDKQADAYHSVIKLANVTFLIRVKAAITPTQADYVGFLGRFKSPSMDFSALLFVALALEVRFFYAAKRRYIHEPNAGC